jgi:hypothetical protein
MEFLKNLPFEMLRRAGTALLTPLKFSWETGHFRSSIFRKSFDQKGNPIPWYTYPAIDFLSTVDFTSQSVLEFGGGHSTLWWAERASYVFSLENNPDWFDYISLRVKEKSNVECLLCEDLVEYAKKPEGNLFDLVIIDGGVYRDLCAKTALTVVKDKGAIILDDSEGFWNIGGLEGEYPIIELFQKAEFSRVDFYGYAPGVINPRCTSIFFKKNANIFENLSPPLRKYKLPQPK